MYCLRQSKNLQIIPPFILTLNIFRWLDIILLLSERQRSPHVLLIFCLQRYFSIDGTYPSPITQDTEERAQGHKDKCEKVGNDIGFCANTLISGSFFLCGGHNFATYSDNLKRENRKSFVGFLLDHVLL